MIDAFEEVELGGLGKWGDEMNILRDVSAVNSDIFIKVLVLALIREWRCLLIAKFRNALIWLFWAVFMGGKMQAMKVISGLELELFVSVEAVHMTTRLKR